MISGDLINVEVILVNAVGAKLCNLKRACGDEMANTYRIMARIC
jgi:hypothetical protein